MIYAPYAFLFPNHFKSFLCEKKMPLLSAFQGILIYMYYFDNIQHQSAHIHVHYQEKSCVIGINDHQIINGKIPNQKLKLVLTWMELHQLELEENWKKAINGINISPISPLS
ncbi:MAG: hypothetical protein RL106_1027 [Bacteroidota bacterium]|jgi:hypothetical protein